MRWRARYVDEHGEEHAKNHPTKVDATRWLDQQISSIITGTHVDPHSRLTVGDVAANWSATLGHLSAKSRYNKLSNLNHRVLPRWGEVRIRDVKPSMIAQWITEMIDEDLSGSLIRKCGGILSQILEFAVRDGDLARNPAEKVKLPAERKKHEPVFLKPPQLRALAESSGPYRSLVETLGVLGLRPGEALALTAGDIDLNLHRLRIVKAYSTLKGEPVLGPTKTHETRTIPIPAGLEELLREQINSKDPNMLVWTSPEGMPIRQDNFAKRFWQPAVKATEGVPNRMWMYDCRHTAASLAIHSGANIKAVQTLLGHKTAAITLDRYGHLYPDDLDALRISLQTAAYPLRTAN